MEGPWESCKFPVAGSFSFPSQKEQSSLEEIGAQ